MSVMARKTKELMTSMSEIRLLLTSANWPAV